MDSAKHRDGKNGPPQGHEWEDAAFGWDNMKDGIFQKIVEEDPQFFEEKRRRMPVWIWAGAFILLVVGAGIWLSKDEELVNFNTPSTLPTDKPLVKNPTIAEESNHFSIKGQKHNHQNKSTNSQIKNRSLKDPITKTIYKKDPPILQDNTTSQPKTELDKKKAIAAIVLSEYNHQTKSAAPQSGRNNLAPTVDLAPLLPLKPFDIRPSDPPTLANLIPSDYGNNNEGNSAEKGQWKITVAGGSLFSFSKYSGNSAAVALRNDHTSPYFGYQYGMDAWMPLSKKDYLLFGFNRRVVYQNIDIYTEQEFDTLLQNGHVKTTHYIVGGRTSQSYSDTLVTGLKKYRLVKYNEFKSVQLQAGYARVFHYKNWHFNPFVNMTIGLLTHSDGWTVASDKSTFAFNDAKPINKRFQFSSQAGMDIERTLNREISLHLQYRYGKQWNNASNEPDMVLRPAFHYFSLGVAKKW